MLHCDFCGLDFEPECSVQTTCSSCPLHNGCAQVACPRCNYPVLPESTLLRWLRETAARWQAGKKQPTQFQEHSKENIA